ncbi:hypothetical protein ACFX11_040807 [Malus domestica]
MGGQEVAEFIDLVLREWNLDLLSNFVPESEREAISQINMGPLMKPDKLVWLFEMNGSYFVSLVISGVITAYPL